MNKLSTVIKATLIAASVLSAAYAAAAWSDRPIRLVVPFPAGGSYDTVARMLSLKLEKKLGQAITLENISGGATVPGVMSVPSSMHKTSIASGYFPDIGLGRFPISGTTLPAGS